MQKWLAFTLLMIGVSASCLAAPAAPEIDPATGGSAIALVTGALLMIRARRRK
jgi:hypothetical protein